MKLLRSSVGMAMLMVAASSIPAISPLAAQIAPHTENEQDDRQTTANQLYQQGLQQFNEGNLPEAIALWEQALPLYQAIGDRVGEGNTLYELGFSLAWLKQYEQAIDHYQGSLAIARETNNRPREAALLGYLGDIYYYQENYTEAIQFCQQSVAIAREVNDQLRQWFSLNCLGASQFAQEEYLVAETHYLESFNLAEQMQEQQLLSLAITSLGLTYFRLEEYKKALPFLLKDLTYQRQQNDDSRESTSLNLIGFAYYWLNDYGQAIDYYNQSLALSRQQGDKPTEQQALNSLGDTYYYLGDYEKAQDFHQQSLVLARQIGDRSAEATALNGLGGDALQLDQLAEGVRFFEQTLEVARENKLVNLEGNALAGLGQAYFSLEQYDRARAAFEQSLPLYKQIGNRYNEGSTYSNLGWVYLAEKNYSQAIAAFEQRLAISEATQELYGQAEALTDLGFAYYKKNDFLQAATHLKNGISTLESIRQKLGDKDALKVTLFDAQTSPYRLLQLVLVAQNESEAALEIAERGRARAFVELLAQRLSPEEANTQSLTPLNLAQIQQVAREQQATLVEYSVINEADKLFIWVVQPSGEIHFRQVDLEPLFEESLGTLVSQSRRSIGVRGRGGLAVVASAAAAASETAQFQRLHQLLIEPVAELLPDDPEAQVIFIPHESLFLIPFPALQSADEEFLIEQHTIRTAPAIQVLDLTQKFALDNSQQPPSSTPIIVGNPDFALQLQQPPYDLAPLPYAEQEAISIGEILGSDVWLGTEATKQTVVQQMPQANLIHLATHGLLDDFAGGGVPGAIALAPSEEDSGLLTASEILEMDLAADLVVLSACDTGRGKITGDGVIGLSRSFITAGVPSVLVSLWSVPDAPTAELMVEFYRQLQQNPDKAQALRNAMLSTKQQYPNPRDWAAFTLIGEAQ